MYKSRKRFANKYVSIAIDTASGEILELVNRKNGDNLIKSTPFNLPNMFSLSLGETRLSVPNLNMVRREPSLKPKITDEKKNNGTEINIVYDKLSDGKNIYDISIILTIFMPNESGKLLFSSKVENDSGYEADKFCFPIISSIYLGENFKDDTLVYPFNAGMKFLNPTEYFAKKPKSIFWRWQEYRYCYQMDGCCGVKNKDGLYSYSSPYSGPLSMAWLDLYDEYGGIYFGMHERNGICCLKADTLGPNSPGMIFSFEKNIESKKDFGMQGIVVALHEGDWHDGADIYRETHENSVCNDLAWWEDSVSLAAHYDFKYQNGGIVHRFKDIPSLVDQAISLNTDHILIAGWHTDGFDNGFPEYFADKELGTEEDIVQGLKYASEKNIKVSFYINTRIANLKFKHLKEFINENAVMKRDGNIEAEGYGDDTLSFATMCAGSKGWRDRLLQAINYVTELGANGVYLDQLAMAQPRICHNPDHNHPIDGWCDGYEKFLKDAKNIKTKSGEPVSIIIEGCSDLYNSNVNGQLVSTFVSLHNGSFPEMYRYTFPKHKLVDMVYPKQNLAMRPVHVAQCSSYMINKAFVTDMYLWIYDLVEDNSFLEDPEQLSYLLKVIELKRKWKKKYKGFVFADDKGISEKSDELTAKMFYKDDLCLIAYSSDGKTVCDFKTDFKADIIEFTCAEETNSVSEALDPDRSYLRISYSRCGMILLKKKK